MPSFLKPSFPPRTTNKSLHGARKHASCFVYAGRRAFSPVAKRESSKRPIESLYVPGTYRLAPFARQAPPKRKETKRNERKGKEKEKEGKREGKRKEAKEVERISP